MLGCFSIADDPCQTSCQKGGRIRWIAWVVIKFLIVAGKIDDSLAQFIDATQIDTKNRGLTCFVTQSRDKRLQFTTKLGRSFVDEHNEFTMVAWIGLVFKIVTDVTTEFFVVQVRQEIIVPFRVQRIMDRLSGKRIKLVRKKDGCKSAVCSWLVVGWGGGDV